MSTLESAKAEAKRKGYKVKEMLAPALLGYEGMNPIMAKKTGFPDTENIIVASNLSSEAKAIVICHELVEIDAMKQGQPYWKAHKKAWDGEVKYKDNLKRFGKCQVKRLP